MWDEVMSGCHERTGERHSFVPECASTADSHDQTCLRNMLPDSGLKYLQPFEIQRRNLYNNYFHFIFRS